MCNVVDLTKTHSITVGDSLLTLIPAGVDHAGRLGWRVHVTGPDGITLGSGESLVAEEPFYTHDTAPMGDAIGWLAVSAEPEEHDVVMPLFGGGVDEWAQDHSDLILGLQIEYDAFEAENA